MKNEPENRRRGETGKNANLLFFSDSPIPRFSDSLFLQSIFPG